MNKTLNIVLAVFGIIALCVVGTGVLGLGIVAAVDHGFSLQSPVVVATEEQVAQAPVEPNSTQQPAVVENTPAQPVQQQTCRAINDYQLQDLPELSVEPGGFLHVEWYVKDGDPERESVLPSGRYLIKTPLRGHVWEYSPSCTPEQVLEQVAGQIDRRHDVGANNAGYAAWQEWLVGKGLIEIVKMTSSTVIPTALPNPTK